MPLQNQLESKSESESPSHASASRRRSNLPSLIGNAAMARVLSSPGAPLPDAVRTRFERAFGALSAPAPVRAGISDPANADEHQASEWASRALSSPSSGGRADFSSVRVHTGADAAASASELGARAYTIGNDIVLGSSAADARLLAHELSHVVQQSKSDAPAVQLDRAANCPASAPATRTIITTADFINLVRRVELDNPAIAADPIATARVVARTKYAGSMWDWMLPSTAGQAGVQQGTNVSADDLGSLCFKLIVTMPGGGMMDPMHLVAAIVANAETQAAGTVSPGLTVFASRLPATLSQRRAATWAGDAGAAAGEWVYWGPTSTKPDKAAYFRDQAPPHDLMSDVDGVAMTSSNAANGFAFDRTASLSSNLERYFNPPASAPRTARFRRFHIFCSVEGLPLEPDGVTLTAAALQTIRDRVNDFAQWYLANNPTIVRNRALTASAPRFGGWMGGAGMSAAIINSQLANARAARVSDIPWFGDQFSAWVQTNLSAEGA